MVSKVQLIAILMLTATTPAIAQGLQAGSMQSMTPSSAIGPEQDSLLPPEVVPIDPSSMTQAQKAGKSADPMELRRQALGQLTGNQTSIAPSAMKPWRAGLQPATTSQTDNSGMPAGAMTSGTETASQSQLGFPNYQMANNQITSGQGVTAQTQTLTGSSQNQPQQTNTRRGGFSNRFSAATTTGLGAIASPLMSGFMMAGPFLRF